MRIDLVLLGLLITMKSVFAVVELTVFLIQFMFAPKLRLLCFKYLKSVSDSTVLSQFFNRSVQRIFISLVTNFE